MKILFTSVRRGCAALAALLLSLGTQAAVYEPGQDVTEFVTGDEYYIYSAPQLSTDEELYNWRFEIFDGAHMPSENDQRGWRAVFEANAPAAGTYGVQLQVRTTCNNWQLGASSTLNLADDTWKSGEQAPAWSSLARPYGYTTVYWDQEAECDRPSSGEWETIFVPVELAEGHNYVVLWVCRALQGWDYINTVAGGQPTAIYVKGVRLMNQGSGDVATTLQQASQRAWQMANYPALAATAGTNFAAVYEQAKTAAAEAADYSSVDLTALSNAMTAIQAAEEELRHGKGLMVEENNKFALPFSHEVRGGDDVVYNERGDDNDVPVVLEYTAGKTLVYKFTTTTAGVFYPVIYAASEANCNFYMNILADDGETKMMSEWVQRVSTEAWQTYKKFSNPSMVNFEAEAGKTYYLTLFMESYVNVRQLSMVKYVKGAKTYDELDELRARAEEYYENYKPGTAGYYSIGCDDELVNRLLTLIDSVFDLDEDSPADQITELYYQIEEIINKLDNAPRVNMTPTDDEHPFDLTNGIFDQWQVENGSNIGYGYKNGSATYRIYNRKDAKFNVGIMFSNATNDESIMSVLVDVITEEGSKIRVAEVDGTFAGTGDWGNQEARQFEGVAIPEGMVIVTFYGTQAATNGFCGNIYNIAFDPIPGTEGEGKKALDAARTAYETTYSVENLQKLVSLAQEQLQNYAFPDYDQTYADQVRQAVEQANAALESGNIDQRAAAYQALEAALEMLPNSMEIVWLQVPSSDNNPFFIEAGMLAGGWQFMPEESKIGMVGPDGSATFYAEVEEAGYYDITIETANPGDGGQFHIAATAIEENATKFDAVMDVPNTGAWDARDMAKTTIQLPEGRVRLVISGENAATSGFVGDIYSISIVPGSNDGIADIVNTNSVNGKCFDLQGRRIERGNLKKGLYIVDGKKMLK